MVIMVMITLVMTTVLVPWMVIVILIMVYRSYSIFFHMKPAIKESERLM
jgi:hypothetical protein